MTDAELATSAVMQALLGFTSEARWLRYAHTHLRPLFPYLPKQPGYNKRLRNAAAMLVTVIRVLASDTSLWTDDVWVADSTPTHPPLADRLRPLTSPQRETTKPIPLELLV